MLLQELCLQKESFLGTFGFRRNTQSNSWTKTFSTEWVKTFFLLSTTRVVIRKLENKTYMANTEKDFMLSIDPPGPDGRIIGHYFHTWHTSVRPSVHATVISIIKIEGRKKCSLKRLVFLETLDI